MNRYIPHILNTFLAVSILYFCFIFFFYSDRGLDITDESYYILRAAHASLYTSDFTNYGFFTGGLYSLAGQNIAGFRMLGFIFLLSAAFFSSFHAVHFISTRLAYHPIGFKRKLFISVLLSAGIFTYYLMTWLITPSYNLIMLFGSLLTFGGVFWFLSGKSVDTSLRSQFLPGLFIGTGSFLMANANPLAALTLSLIAYTLILFFATTVKSRFTILFIIVPVVFVQFGTYIYWVAGTFSAYLENVRVGLELSSLLGSGHSPGSVLRRTVNSTLMVFNPVEFLRHSYLYLSVMIVSGFIIRYTPKLQSKKELYLDISWITIFSVYTLLHFNSIRFYGIEIIYIVFLFIISIFLKEFLIHNKNPKTVLSDFHSVFLIVLILSSVAFFMRFGTNNDIVSASFAGAYFYFVAIYLLSHSLFKSRQLLALYFTFFLLFTVLFKIQQTSHHSPYRLITSLSEQTYLIQIPDNPTQLYVDQATYQWANTLQEDALSAGWKPGNFLLDFTGATPGAAVILNARAPGRAWLIGSYEGSDEYVLRSLSLVDPAVIENSWILTTPDGNRRISDEVLEKLGIRLEENYLTVSVISTGYRNERQLLWKPGN